ncbi:DUF1735 and LamG domain-containing protein [Bacteroides finegoldii]|uniref:Patatin-like protein n=1 Tax=Bacteroides finegoldii TaxID=338188 RepID=A0A174E2G2_9BACE|nr:DUF1735 and LamG domain-containing protein [Bacteroides finegoldii]MCG4683165.1 DUF1735 and LamG domain-containing protein [Bacteroides finegoldii]CDC53543.1 putative uncharacterized protein [Bacteroides finegoldii CAG:203]CUO31657.1 patatin-like protein [Bacteroides finegoldii]
MKLHKYMFASLSFCSLVLGSCQNNDIDDEHHYDNKVFVTSQQVRDDLLIKETISEATRSISYRLADPLDREVNISFDAAPQLTAAYNLAFNDNAQVLAADYYEIPVKSVTIKAGDISSDDVVVNFKNTNKLDKSRRYVLPVTITDADIEVLDSKRTAYFIFKGAALINVVANIEKIYFPISWKTDMSNVNAITVEALLRSDDWEAGRDNALSSIFGIEGRFLLRIGDADRPRDQLQCVAPGGNFPAPNAVAGLPTKEWVHIAVVYDAGTHERIYYKDGVKVYSDENATYALNLTSGCYIGKSYDNTRWLPGDISEVRIWNIQRTGEEIAKNPYEVDPHASGLVAYWKFNEGTGSAIKDHTGNGNDITASGTPTWVNVELPPVK